MPEPMTLPFESITTAAASWPTSLSPYLSTTSPDQSVSMMMSLDGSSRGGLPAACIVAALWPRLAQPWPRIVSEACGVVQRIASRNPNRSRSADGTTSADGFCDQPAVINGASSLLLEVFGEAGRHTRSAIGVASLPRNAPVEVELIVRLIAEFHGGRAEAADLPGAAGASFSVWLARVM